MKAAIAVLALVATAAAAQPLPAPEPIVVVYPNRPITYAQVSIRTSSTTILPAAPWIRFALDLWNVSGRIGGPATDAWCVYGVPAVVGQGFSLMGGGGNVFRWNSGTLDGRALNCIASAPVTINLGSNQL